MKRTLLSFLMVALVLPGFSQGRHFTDVMQRGTPQLSVQAMTPDAVPVSFTPPVIGAKSTNVIAIGNTWFDTQTNSGNLMTRLYEHPDGTIAATWMLMGQGGSPDRGTAYCYYDGTSWSTPEPHLGSDPRNGFPCYAPWGPDGEIVAHYQYIANQGPIKLLRRPNKGSGPWQEIVLPPPDGNYSIVWHSMITSGPNHEYVHLLALVYDDPYQGQDDALLYYRSPDGGDTWDINGVIIEGLGSAYFKTIASLTYGWAQPVGNTIAFTYGFNYFDGLVFKSNDNGTTWQKFVVYQAPYTPFNLPDVTPVYGAGDGTSAITLDSQGKAHVVFSRMNWFHDVVTTPPGGWYYYPTSTEGLIYWNETMPPLDSTIVSSFTLDSLEARGHLVGWVIPDTTITMPSDQPNYGLGLTSMPQLGIDNSDNLYLTWAALSPRHFSGTYYYRHLYCNASNNGGATWTGIKPITDDILFIFSECVYPALSPIVDDKIHVLFQEDFTPGTGSGEENFIDYMSIPKDIFVGMKENSRNPDCTVSQVFPNPAGGSARITITLEKPATAGIALSDLTGNTIRTMTPRVLPVGPSTVTLDINGFAPGVYLCTITVEGKSVTRKVAVL